jgi:hypothetical protein
VEREDVRVVQPCDGLDLTEESLTPKRGGQLGFQHLDCNFAMVLLVLGEKDDGHAAAPELALEGVRRGERRLKLRAEIRHTARCGEHR